MALDGTKYLVAMKAADGEKLTAEIFARTPGLASKAAELQNPGFVSVFLTVRKIGECDRCGTVIFEGHKETIRLARGIYHCGEC